MNNRLYTLGYIEGILNSIAGANLCCRLNSCSDVSAAEIEVQEYFSAEQLVYVIIGLCLFLFVLILVAACGKACKRKNEHQKQCNKFLFHLFVLSIFRHTQ